MTYARSFRYAALLVSATAAIPAMAAVTVDIRQVGNDVATSVSGSVDLTGLTLARSGVSSLAGVRGAPFLYGAGDMAATDAYIGFAGPVTAGSGGLLVQATASAGSVFALNGNYPLTGTTTLFLSSTYQSGVALAATSLFAGATIASLGLTEGRYIYRSSVDTITFNIGTSTPSVPEPATWAMMVIGFGLVGTGLRFRGSQPARS